MTLLIGSAALEEALLLSYLKKATRIIAVDGGLHHLETLGVRADIYLGDYDSYRGVRPKEARVFPEAKDFSDMEAALKLVGEEEVVILGATGGRLDHFLSVLFLMDRRENIQLVDGQNRLFYRRGHFCLKKEEGYFSLFPLRPTFISIRGAKYDLDHVPASSSTSLLLSNQWLCDVDVYAEDWVLVVLSRDK